MYSFYQVLDGQNLTVVNISSVRFIRFYPKTWKNEMCMRVQVYKEVGSNLTGTFCLLTCTPRKVGGGGGIWRFCKGIYPELQDYRAIKAFFFFIKALTAIPWLPMF